MLPGPLKDAVDVWMWKRCYSMQEVNSALSKVQLVGYSQKVVRTAYVQEIFKISHFCFLAMVTSPCLFSRFFFLAGVVWSCTSLPIELRLLAGQLQLDHPVSPREGVLCVWLISTHHTSSGRPAGLMLHHFKVYWA